MQSKFWAGWGWVVVLGSVGAAGCGAAPDLSATGDADDGLEYEVDSAQQGLGEASCATIAPDEVVWPALGTDASPRSYNRAGCYKARVYDIDTEPGTCVQASMVGLWADVLPTTQAACENL